MASPTTSFFRHDAYYELMAVRARLQSMLGALVLLFALAAPSHAQTFDWKLYERWTVSHHRPFIPMTSFGWPWMRHRAMCGGALTGQILNLRNYAVIQLWQGCWAVQNVDSHHPVFHPAPWVR
jgi:hypothetical protein